MRKRRGDRFDNELRKDQDELTVAGLTYDWWVFPNVDAKIKKDLKPGLPGLLRQLATAANGPLVRWRRAVLPGRRLVVPAISGYL